MKKCVQCILPETYEGIRFDDEGVCNYCKENHSERNVLDTDDFQSEDELIEALLKYRNSPGKYDVLVPLSGGVDSTNALIEIVEKYKLRPLAFHNDHGYEDRTATNNVMNICRKLEIDLILMQQDIRFMKEMWKTVCKSSIKGVTSCYICGNILYLNALEIAERHNIPLVINGYSKGQASMVSDKEKGLDLFDKTLQIINESDDDTFIDEFLSKYSVLDKRIAYDGKKDLIHEVDRSKILVLPFYIFNFYKSDKDKLKEKLVKKFRWESMETSYPARTTNCEMVWLNSYTDLKKMGYTSYHIEYAELIRKGEISREEAVSDLNFMPPEGKLEKLASSIGLDFKSL